MKTPGCGAGYGHGPGYSHGPGCGLKKWLKWGLGAHFGEVLEAIKPSWRSRLGRFWRSKTFLEPRGVPSWLQDPKKHPQVQWERLLGDDVGSILGPKMVQKSIENGSNKWSIIWLIFGRQKVPTWAPKTPHNGAKKDQVWSKMWFYQKVKTLQKYWKNQQKWRSGVPRWACWDMFTLPKWHQKWYQIFDRIDSGSILRAILGPKIDKNVIPKWTKIKMEKRYGKNEKKMP